MKQRLWIQLWLCLLLHTGGFAQQQNNKQANRLVKPNIMVLARNYGDSVVLRWSPDSPAYWLAGNAQGYLIERIEYTQNTTQGTRQLLTPTPIKPWTLEQMKNRLTEHEKGIGIVAEMIYGYTSDKKFNPDFFSIKKISQEQNLRFATTLTAAEFYPKAAEAAGLRFVDKNIKKKDVLYMYKIYMAQSNASTHNATLDTAQVIIEAEQSFLTFAPFVYKPENGDKKTTLLWDRLGPEGNFSAFYIEKSEDGKTFKKLNQTPFVMGKPDPEALSKDSLLKAQFARWENKAMYIDSLAQNYRKYYYRIRGIDSFGDESKPSEMIVAMGTDQTPPLSPDDFQAKNVNNKAIVLSWKKTLKEADLKGFVIGRGATPKGPFKPITQQIIPPNATSFTDTEPQAYVGDYYIIASIDTAGNMAYTLPIAGGIEDHQAPAPPNTLAGKVDSMGKVTITWKSPNNPDVASFKVYRSYTPENKYYTQITPVGIINTNFTDSMPNNMLNEKVYYKVVAIDLSNNHSNFSDFISIKLPDRHPPTTPIIKDISISDKGVSLVIIGSQSDDVQSHLVYRKDNKENWIPLQEIPYTQTTTSWVFQDETVVANQSYVYAVAAKDDDGLFSPKSFPMPITFFKKNTYPTVSQLIATHNTEQKQIVVTWQIDKTDAISHYIIYRTVNNKGLETIGTSTNPTYIDKDVQTNNQYQYAVKVAYQNGKFSGISPLSSIGK